MQRGRVVIADIIIGDGVLDRKIFFRAFEAGSAAQTPVYQYGRHSGGGNNAYHAGKYNPAQSHPFVENRTTGLFFIIVHSCSLLPDGALYRI